jgi:hypothetical protein
MECMPTTLSKNRNRNRKIPLKPTPKARVTSRGSMCPKTPIVIDVSQNADCDDDVAERRSSVSMPEAYWCV